jgi:hypothetical protein
MDKNPPRPKLRRRDATGHLDPQYAAELLEQSGEKQTSDPPPAGFVEDASDELAEELGENFVHAATSAEDGDEDEGDELIRDEPSVPDGDDDDIDFETEELSFPPGKATRTEPKPALARRTPRPKAKVAQARPAKAKASRGSATSKTKAKAVKAKAVKAVKAKAKATKAKPTRKTRKHPARKTSKR